MFPYVEPDNSHLAMDDYKVSYYGGRNYDEGLSKKTINMAAQSLLETLE